MSKQKTVLYLGSSGFPFGMAAIQRQLQISKALKSIEINVSVINRKGVHTSRTINEEKISTRGSFEGINYIFASGTPLYPRNFIIRNFLKLVGALVELKIIIDYRFFKNLTCLIVNTSSLALLMYYKLIAGLINIKIVYDYVEYRSSIDDRSMTSPSKNKSFDTQFINFVDALIIISPYLKQHVQKIAPELPFITIPPIIDFEKFNRIKTNAEKDEYFLFCGSTQYLDVFEFIIKAYYKTKSVDHGVSLILIINGDPKIIASLKAQVSTDKSILILSSLSYEKLIEYYKNAKALLIPLQNNLQDTARFPFKISEYTAAARPIVTSNAGAIVAYFEDGKNALLAKSGDCEDFSDKLIFILNNTERAEQIAREGYTLGLKQFNYKSYSNSLLSLISLIDNKT